MTTHGSQPVHSTCFLPGDWMVFGAETQGCRPVAQASASPAPAPAMVPGQRSLNLSNAVAVTVFEAWRQNSFAMPDGQVMVEPRARSSTGSRNSTGLTGLFPPWRGARVRSGSPETPACARGQHAAGAAPRRSCNAKDQPGGMWTSSPRARCSLGQQARRDSHAPRPQRHASAARC